MRLSFRGCCKAGEAEALEVNMARVMRPQNLQIHSELRPQKITSLWQNEQLD